MTTGIDPFDELAAMFLSAPAPSLTGSMSQAHMQSLSSRAGERSNAGTRLHPRARRSVELAIVGHLPVRAGLWLTPYADALAREQGCVALLRLDLPEPSLQIVRGVESLAQARLGPSLEQAIDSLSAYIDVWVIRPAGDDQAAALLRSGADRITILTSADEAAMVAAYQIVKDLMVANEQTQLPVPPIALAVLGADATQAAAVVERLNRTTVSFLGVEVCMGTCLQRMDAGVKSTMYETFGGQPQAALDELVAHIRRSSIASSAPGSMADSPAAEVEGSPVIGRVHADRTDHLVMRAEEILQQAPKRPILQPLREEVLSKSEPHVFESASAAAPRPAKLAPKPAAEFEAKHPAKPIEPDEQGKPLPLHTYVKGLRALPVRSPGHEQVELAVDERGRLHVLCRHQFFQGMCAVESWARAHHEILSMACPQHAFDVAAKTIRHVFTDEPAAVAQLHATDVRLHVLAPVTVGDKVGWYAAPLNLAAR